MMASFGKRLTRFCGRTNHSRGPSPDFACSWERPLFLARLFGKPDHALWPKLQGKLNREFLNIQRFGRFGNLRLFSRARWLTLCCVFADPQPLPPVFEFDAI
jgi:hypothetical protein